MIWLVNLFQNIVFQTVISGVLVVVLGFVVIEIIKFFLKPSQKLKKIIGIIDNKLKFYDNVITSSIPIRKELVLECLRTLKKLSCDLEETYKQISIKNRTKKQKISDSVKRLTRLSNSLGDNKNSSENGADINKIRENLNIQEL